MGVCSFCSILVMSSEGCVTSQSPILDSLSLCLCITWAKWTSPHSLVHFFSHEWIYVLVISHKDQNRRFINMEIFYQKWMEGLEWLYYMNASLMVHWIKVTPHFKGDFILIQRFNEAGDRTCTQFSTKHKRKSDLSFWDQTPLITIPLLRITFSK